MQTKGALVSNPNELRLNFQVFVAIFPQQNKDNDKDKNEQGQQSNENISKPKIKRSRSSNFADA